MEPADTVHYKVVQRHIIGTFFLKETGAVMLSFFEPW